MAVVKAASFSVSKELRNLPWASNTSDVLLPTVTERIPWRAVVDELLTSGATEELDGASLSI